MTFVHASPMRVSIPAYLYPIWHLFWVPLELQKACVAAYGAGIQYLQLQMDWLKSFYAVISWG